MADGRGRAFAGGVAVGVVCAGAAGWLAWRTQPPAEAAAGVQAVATYSRVEPETAPAAPPEESLAAAPVTLSDAAASPAPLPSAAKYTTDYPVFEKLVSKPLSREPHQLLGAWD